MSGLHRIPAGDPQQIQPTGQLRRTAGAAIVMAWRHPGGTGNPEKGCGAVGRHA